MGGDPPPAQLGSREVGQGWKNERGVTGELWGLRVTYLPKGSRAGCS